MKNTLLFLLLLLSVRISAQNADTILMLREYLDKIDFDPVADSLCRERGHIEGGILFASDREPCSPFVSDEPDTTFIVYPACVVLSYTCRRCNREQVRVEPELREVVWVRPRDVCTHSSYRCTSMACNTPCNTCTCNYCGYSWRQ